MVLIKFCFDIVATVYFEQRNLCQAESERPFLNGCLKVLAEELRLHGGLQP